MKLATFARKTAPEQHYIGILDGDSVIKAITEYRTMVDLIASGELPTAGDERYALPDVTLKAPLMPRKIICVGRNYVEHAKELGNTVPDEPMLFAKLPSSVIATGDLIRWHASVTAKVDWEVELAVVIGAPARYASEEDAWDHVFGYTIANDVTARDLQNQDKHWLRAKGMDTFCPLGPCIVTRDEITNPHALTLQTEVNGELMQNSSTRLMMYKIAFLIHYCSQAFTLEPGDLILTGTPGGVGKGMNPPRYLKDGDIVEVSVSGIGAVRNSCWVEEAHMR